MRSRFRWSCRRIACKSVDASRQPSGHARTASPKPELTNIAQLKLGTMPGLIERFNGQHIVSLTANIHGITLGEAAQEAESGAGRRRSAASRRQGRS